MKTIRGKIVLSFVAVFTIVFVMYGYTIFSTSYRFIYRELQKSSEDNLSYVQENINRLLDQFIALSDNVYYNRNIARVMIRNYEKNPDANLDRDLQSALVDIASFEGNGIVSQYATCLVLHGVNGQTIRYGNDADYISVEQIQNMKEFSTYNDKHNARILSSVDTFSSQTYAKKYLRIIRSAISLDSYRKIGWQYIGISTDLIADTIRDYNFDPTSILFVYDNEGALIYCNRRNELDDSDDGLACINNPSGAIVSYGGNRWMLVKNASAISGLTMVQLLDYSTFQGEITLFLRSTAVVFGVAILFALAMTAILSRWLTTPIQRNIAALQRISNGDFSIDRSLEGTDEVGQMGKAINSLATNINSLMEKAREEEKTKKQLEYKFLQNQINPHFVYNVLNSIKVMAQLQGAENISRLVNSFGGLLKEVSKGVNDKVTIQEEFRLVDQYVYIMNLRKMGLIQVTYQIQEGLEECLILKFLLQPLVENAIVHGFDGKQGIKKLEIAAIRRNNYLEVSVCDNGNGMTEDEIRAVLSDAEGENAGAKYNAVGIHNIQERIHLLYGEEFGVSYESAKTEFTKAIVRLPVEVEGKTVRGND